MNKDPCVEVKFQVAKRSNSLIGTSKLPSDGVSSHYLNFDEFFRFTLSCKKNFTELTQNDKMVRLHDMFTKMKTDEKLVALSFEHGSCDGYDCGAMCELTIAGTTNKGRAFLMKHSFANTPQYEVHRYDFDTNVTWEEQEILNLTKPAHFISQLAFLIEQRDVATKKELKSNDCEPVVKTLDSNAAAVKPLSPTQNNTELKNLQDKLFEVRAELCAKTEQELSDQTELNRLRNALDASRNKQLATEAELATVKQIVEAEIKKISDAKREIDTQITDIETAKTKLDTQLKGVTAEKAKLADEKTKLADERATLEKEKTKLEAQRIELNDDDDF